MTGKQKVQAQNDPEKIVGYPEKADIFHLPSNIHDPSYQGNHYFQLTCLYPVARQDTSDQTGVKARYHIILPVPAGLTASYSANYGTYSETGETVAATQIVNSAAAGFRLGEFAGDGGIKGAALGALGALAGGINKGIDILKGSGEAAKAEIAGVLGEGFKQSYLRGKGKAWRNIDTMAFTGMSLREWNFSWKIVPKNFNEMSTLIELRKRVVASIHPSTAGSIWFMGYPDYFAFVVRSKSTPEQQSKMLPKSAPCFMTNFNITFNGSGNPTFFEGAGPDNISEPVEYDISFTLRETRALSRESLAGEPEGPGAGIDSGVKRKVGVPN